MQWRLKSPGILDGNLPLTCALFDPGDQLGAVISVNGRRPLRARNPDLNHLLAHKICILSPDHDAFGSATLVGMGGLDMAVAWMLVGRSGEVEHQEHAIAEPERAVFFGADRHHLPPPPGCLAEMRNTDGFPCDEAIGSHSLSVDGGSQLLFDAFDAFPD